MLNRRDFLKHTLVSAVGYAGLSSITEAAASRKPNVIWFVSDDQGIADVDVFQHKTAIHMPNLVKLARRGVRFTEAYANCFMCAPSRAGIMLGGYQQSIGIYGNQDTLPGIPAKYKIAPEYFKELGYTTALIGKWHLGGRLTPETAPLNKGFDRAWYWYGSTHDYWLCDVGEKFGGGGIGYCPIFDQNEKIDKMDYLTSEITKQACDFIDRNKNRPFFLYLNHHCAHVPLQVPKPVHDKYEKLGYGSKATISRAMYEVMDDGLGAVMEKLEKYGLSENTIIIYTSDNGGAVPSGPLTWPYKAGKFTMLEGGLRVPFMISWPGTLPQNKIYGYPVMHMDMLPTSLAAAGSTGPGREGVNVLPYIRGEKAGRPHEKMFWCVNENSDDFAVRAGDWKLLRTGIAEGLFNLAEDPTETADLSAAYPEKVTELLKAYNQWQKRNPKPLLTKEMRKRVNDTRNQLEKEYPGLSTAHTFGPDYKQETRR